MSKKSPSKKHKPHHRGFLHFLLVSLALFVVAAGAGLFYASSLLCLKDAPQRADAIVVLGGEAVRAFHAARLYRDGFAPLIYIDKPAVSPGDEKIRAAGIVLLREEELVRQILLKSGVPETALRYYGPTKSTAEEALLLSRNFAGKRCDLLVVTSPYHARRARMIIRDALPSPCVITVVGTPDEPVYDAWWRDQDAARFVLLESAKILFYKLGGRYST